jgi:lysozyme
VTRIRGLDASSVQGKIDFKSVTTSGWDIQFAILKAQEGNEHFDPYFERNITAAIAVGIEPFAYCFAYPLPSIPGSDAGRDPKEQAQLFVERVCRYPELAKRPIFLDYEWPPPNEWAKWGMNGAAVNEWCLENAAEVHRLTGVRPSLYTYPWWWAELRKGNDVAWAADYPLWIASYNTQGKWPLPSQKPTVPGPWADWLFWQFDGDHGLHLPNGLDCDFCLFNGSREDLNAFAGWSPLRA